MHTECSLVPSLPDLFSQTGEAGDEAIHSMYLYLLLVLICYHLSFYAALLVLGIPYHPVVYHCHPDNLSLLNRCLLLLLQEC